MQIIDDGLLREFSRRPACEWCGRPNRGGLHPHHYWQRRGMGGGSRLDMRENLIALCLQCHEAGHWGRITREQFLQRVAVREGRPGEEIVEDIRRVHQLPRGQSL